MKASNNHHYSYNFQTFGTCNTWCGAISCASVRYSSSPEVNRPFRISLYSSCRNRLLICGISASDRCIVYSTENRWVSREHGWSDNCQDSSEQIRRNSLPVQIWQFQIKKMAALRLNGVSGEKQETDSLFCRTAPLRHICENSAWISQFIMRVCEHEGTLTNRRLNEKFLKLPWSTMWLNTYESWWNLADYWRIMTYHVAEYWIIFNNLWFITEGYWCLCDWVLWYYLWMCIMI